MKRREDWDLKRALAELSAELGRQALLEEALRRARDRLRLDHERRAGALAPYALAYEPHGEAYLDEALASRGET